MPDSKQISRLIDEHRRQLGRRQAALLKMMLVKFDQLGAYDEAAAEAFRAALFGATGAAVDATVTQTKGYAQLLARMSEVEMSGTVPTKLVRRANQGRLTDPFNVFGKAMSDGAAFDEAVQRARSTVESLASDFIFGSSRESMAFIAEDSDVRWVRALGPKSCDWCVSLSRVEWDSPGDATFGHDNCSCTPVPASSGHAINRAELEKAGGGDADVTYDVRSQRSNLSAARARANRHRRRWESELATADSPSQRRRIETRIEDYRAQADWADARIEALST